MHHVERCTGPEWRAHAAHARKNAPHACFGHAKSVPQALCTPRVHGLTIPTHARRRAGHPLAGGRLYRQAQRRASHLGQTRELLAQEHEHIGGRRQAGILTI